MGARTMKSSQLQALRRGSLSLLRRQMSSSQQFIRTRGLPTEAIGRVKPKRGGASSAARARLAQVLSTVKDKSGPNPSQQPYTPRGQPGCPSCGATHAEDAPHVPPPSPDPVASIKEQTLIKTETAAQTKHEAKPMQHEAEEPKPEPTPSKAAEKILRAAKAASQEDTA